MDTTTPSMAPQDACQKGHYPYPDSCVKLIVGVAEDTETLALFERMRAMLVIATSDDLAKIAFENRHPGFVPLVILALTDVRQQLQRMRILADQQSFWLKKLISPYLVTYFDSYGKMHRKYVLARSALQARRNAIPQPFAGTAIPQKMLEELFVHMEKARTGDEDVHYAMDHRKGGEWRRALQEKIKNQTAEEKKWMDEQVKNHRKFFPGHEGRREHGVA